MIEAGQIYDIWFPFKPPILPGQVAGKYRPALILSAADNGTIIAIAIKITSSGPTKRFPLRIPIVDWTQAGLDNASYAEIDSEISISFKGTVTPRGNLTESDFNKILMEYIKHQRKVRHQGKTST